ncbi:Invertebrate potassium voltage-gated channel KQT-like protein [Sarcoptes scabiei]|uniref:Invertebrate potassium voltage-gated channel KQT-like protein n=1 Tax=Sarcoptes scabiei TaxID=52283 RepID=A0A132A2A8_SARSC|nr:Invertebrate potassium voltage-gated channel KQT-like protein [Sarcoptes scabiei]
MYGSIIYRLNSSRYKYLVYTFLNVPNNRFSISYQILLMLLISICILVTMCMAIGNGTRTYYNVMFWLDLICMIIFIIEYLLNVWASTVLPKYSGRNGLILILFNPLYLIDLVVIGLTVADVVLDILWLPLAAGLRGFRMIHFFQYRFVFIKLLWESFWSERFQLMIAFYHCLLWIFSIGFLMYFIEHAVNSYFQSVANSVWWAVVTFTTVGYGYGAPITVAGKLIAALAMIPGIWFFALPAGIIGASLASKCDERKNGQYQSILRLNVAASMLQNAWRIHRINVKLRNNCARINGPLLILNLTVLMHS